MTRASRKSITRDPVELACELNDAAVAAYHQGQLHKAERWFRRALRLLEAAEGTDSPDVANVINSLAAIYENRCDYHEAERLYERAVNIVQDLDGDEDVERLRLQSLANLGRIYRMQGRYSSAEPLLLRALALAEGRFGGECFETAT